jgi:hypothetical protein
MGTNRRYGEGGITDRIDQAATRGVEPDTLTDEQLDLDNEPLTTLRRARPVTAWVKYGGIHLRVDAELVAWTARAVAVRWRAPNGEIHKAWVWASAVEDR